MTNHTHSKSIFKSTASALAIGCSLFTTNMAHAQTEAQSFSYGGQTLTYLQDGNVIYETFSDDTAQSPERALRYEQDEAFRISLVDGPRQDVSDIVSVSYSNDGRTKTVANSLGHEIVFAYGANNELLSKIDANGMRTTFSYRDNRVSAFTVADGTSVASTTRLTYDETGQVTQLTLPSGRVVTDVTDESGNYTSQARAVFESLQGAMTDRSLEGLHKQASQNDKQALARELSRGVAQEDAVFDDKGRLTSFIDSNGGVTNLKYDVYDNLKKVIDARGVITLYKYDGFGQLVKETSAERGVTKYNYDEAGNLTREVRAGDLIIIRNYDALNRVTRTVYKQNGVDKKVTSFTYDSCANGISRLCRVNADGHVTRYSYNARGQYTQVSTKYDGRADFETTRYTYGTAGRLEKIHYPTDLVVKYHYTDAGLVHKVTGFYGANNERESFVVAKNISIDPEQSRLDALTFGNGLKTAFTYDDNNRLSKQVTRANGQVSARAVYKRGDDGTITAINRLESAQSQKFTYDNMNRLTGEKRGGETLNSYSYDSAGNRTALTSPDASKTYRYAPDANRLTEINRQILSYDARGNLLSDRNGKRGFAYDVTNRLNAYTKNGAPKASYAYNAYGQRIEKTLSGVGTDADGTRTTNFAYTPEGWLLSEIGRKEGGTRTFTDEYIWLGGRPLAKLSRKIKANGQTAKAEIAYLHTDHLATPRSATNADGTTVWAWESDAFGASIADRDPDGDGVKTKVRLRFPGQYYDDESGLHYNHHRDYDPKLGRYIQSDPIGLWGSDNRYGYVGGNPINLIDPTGLIEVITTCQRYICTLPPPPPPPSPVDLDGAIPGAGGITYMQLTGAFPDNGNPQQDAPEDEGRGLSIDSDTTCSRSTLQGKINQKAAQLASLLSSLGSDGKEHGYILGIQGGQVIGIGPFTSNESGSISPEVILTALQGYETIPLVGAIHNHPSLSVGGSDFTNRINENPSPLDTRIDDILNSNGFNAGKGTHKFSHFILSPTNKLRIFKDNFGNLSTGTKTVQCPIAF